MGDIATALGFTLAVVSAPACVTAGASFGTNPDSAGVQETERRWEKAFNGGDVTFLDALLSPQYVSVDTHGRLHSRAEELSLAVARRAGGPPPHYRLDDLRIEIHEHAAIVRGVNVSVNAAGGETRSRLVDVFFYENGRWRPWYSQHTTAL